MNLTQRVLNKINTIIHGPPVRDRIVVKVVDDSKRNNLKPGFLIGTYRSWSEEEIAAAKELTAVTMMKLGYEI